MNRRGFIGGIAATFAAGCAAVPRDERAEAKTVPDGGDRGRPFRAGEPCLQAPAETTMGVSWAVSGLAKGVVEIADNPEMRNARTVKSGGYGLVPIDAAALQVRLEGLKPSTRYWYRTVTTPFAGYANIYEAKLGEPVVGKVHSFVTPGVAAVSRFCAMSDTHAFWNGYGKIAAKLKALRPPIVVWDGDATNSTEDKATAVRIFLDPPVADADYAADIPVAFENGNHDFRGSWISKKEEVVMPRHPGERSAGEWDLKWNFAVRQGELALIGMDTGEDKPDGHPKWFGLANFEPYRKAQAAWLEKALSRPDIASAAFKIVFCHIPLYAAPEHPSYPNDGVKIDPSDYARWSRECFDLWNPVLERHGVRLVVAGHVHCHRVDPPSAGRNWYQVTCGSPKTLPVRVGWGERYPAVVEGGLENGKLVLRVHDVDRGRVVNEVAIAP